MKMLNIFLVKKNGIFLAKSQWNGGSWADACRNCQPVWFPAPVVLVRFDYEPLVGHSRYLILFGFMFSTPNRLVKVVDIRKTYKYHPD